MHSTNRFNGYFKFPLTKPSICKRSMPIRLLNGMCFAFYHTLSHRCTFTHADEIYVDTLSSVRRFVYTSESIWHLQKLCFTQLIPDNIFVSNSLPSIAKRTNFVSNGYALALSVHLQQLCDVVVFARVYAFASHRTM